ncbi:Lon protease [Sodalis praecaptivus]
MTGLAWTEVGGDLLTIETACVPGKGKLTYTGSLGEVMQESIQAALTVVRARADKLGINPDFYEKAIFTCTCRKAPPLKMARAPGSRCVPRWCPA